MATLNEQFASQNRNFLRLLRQEIETVFNRAGIAMVKETRSLQDSNKNYASRRLSNSTNYKLKTTKLRKTLTFGANAKSKGYPYGIVQEFGRKAGAWPNIGSIEKWVRRKVRLGHMQLTKELGKNNKSRIKTLTFLIARAIKNNGIKGKFYYQKGFLEGNKLFAKEMQNVVERAFNV